jgi:hypothetical protein
VNVDFSVLALATLVAVPLFGAGFGAACGHAASDLENAGPDVRAEIVAGKAPTPRDVVGDGALIPRIPPGTYHATDLRVYGAPSGGGLDGPASIRVTLRIEGDGSGATFTRVDRKGDGPDVETHGGLGYTWDFGADGALRDAFVAFDDVGAPPGEPREFAATPAGLTLFLRETAASGAGVTKVVVFAREGAPAL